MTNTFANALGGKLNISFTEKNAIQRESTGNTLLDYFSAGGSDFNEEVAQLFNRSLIDHEDETFKLLFYFRDVRGGQGRRSGFRHCLNFLATNDHYRERLGKNLPLIAEYGRWDDLYALVDTPLEAEAFKLMHVQYEKDLKAIKEGKQEVSLLGKWLKSESTSSKLSRALAKKTIEHFGISAKEYRKNNAELRKTIEILETKLTNKNYNFDYEGLPSQAMLKYIKAFKRNDEKRYDKYLEKVSQGKAKINTDTLFPSQIVRKVLINDEDDPKGIGALWDNLPDYIGDKEENAIAVVDVSGSMEFYGGDPICVSVGLGIYLAERLKGPYANKFITFSKSPSLQEVKGKDIVEKINYLSKADWTRTTNIEMVFDLILETATQKGVKKEDMIDRIYIISDMQFDEATQKDPDKYATLMNTIKARFEAAKVVFPQLVFWNVRAASGVPMALADGDFISISGYSPSIFKNLLNMKKGDHPALAIVDEIVNSERYKGVS